MGRLAPVAAWIALRGAIVLASPGDLVPALVLGAAVLFWVAGFDILYALMDIEFDRRSGLFSIPARLGAQGGLAAAGLCHMLTVLCLALMVPLLALGKVYLAGLFLAMALILYEHWLLYRHGLTKLNVAFFNVNGALSIGLFLFTLGDLLIG